VETGNRDPYSESDSVICGRTRRVAPEELGFVLLLLGLFQEKNVVHRKPFNKPYCNVIVHDF
jgi:hypothetical protein